MNISFGSDNEAPVRDEILQAVIDANRNSVPSYGEDEYTRRMQEKFCEVFEANLEVLPLVSGTAANGIALSRLVPSFGATLCHEHAHIRLHECGAPEFFSGGKVLALPGGTGKISASEFTGALDYFEAGGYHNNMVAALSLTQATEYGTVYTPAELAELSDLAHGRGVLVHMDGARFANALAHLGCSPAELSWKSGVDALSFGASKNGTMNADALMFFDPEHGRDFKRRLKQAGHLMSKTRYLSSQMLAYLDQGRWLQWAKEANELASQLADAIERSPHANLVFPVQSNVLFVEMSAALRQQLLDNGVLFYPSQDFPQYDRLVLSNINTASDIDAFCGLLSAWRPAA